MTKQGDIVEFSTIIEFDYHKYKNGELKETYEGEIYAKPRSTQQYGTGFRFARRIDLPEPHKGVAIGWTLRPLGFYHPSSAIGGWDYDADPASFDQSGNVKGWWIEPITKASRYLKPVFVPEEFIKEL